MELDRSFYVRFAELCREAARGLRDLERDHSEGRAAPGETLERLFRISHDLAGQAGLLERRRVCLVAALAAERLRGRTSVPDATWAPLFACIGRLLECAALDALGEPVESDVDALVRDLTALL